MSCLGDITGPVHESVTSMALRYCGYMRCNRKVQIHVERETGVRLTLERVERIRQALPPGRGRADREGFEPSDMPVRREAAARANRRFLKALGRVSHA